MNKTITVENVKNILAKHDIPYAWEHVERAIDYSIEAKTKLREIFRNHPNWNEDADAIVFTTDENRSCDANEVWKCADNLFEYVYNNADETNKELMINQENWTTFSALRDFPNQFVTEEMVDKVTVCGIPTRAGEKTSRVWNKFFKKFANGDIRADKFTDKTDDTPATDHSWLSYDKLFAKLADSINPMTVKRITVISLNICDFLNMSYGTEWKSCHRLGEYCDRGEWSGGTLSYALDDVTAIFYTVSSEYDGTNYCMEPKINRQLFFFKGDAIVQSRLYPASDDTVKIEQYRNVVQHIYADCIHKPNLWTVKKDHSSFNDMLTTAARSKHYTDYKYNYYNVNMSVLKGSDIGSRYKIRIGSPSRCLCCDREYTSHQGIVCGNCDNNSRTCTYCGCTIRPGEGVRRTIRFMEECFCPECAAENGITE